MKTKKVDKKKTLAYAVAFYFTEASIKFMMGNTMYEYVHTVYDRRYDNGGFNTLAVVYNYKKMKYEVLVVSDEKVNIHLAANSCDQPKQDECRREAAHHSGQGMCRKARRTAFGTHFAFLHKTTPPCSYQKVCMEVSVHSGFICWRCCPPGYPAKASRRPESPSV